MILRQVPTLDEIATEPARADTLPRVALLDLANRALTVHGVLVRALIMMPTEVTAAPPDQLIGTRELARRMNVTANFVYDHADEWPFTIRRAGMRVMFSVRGFETWVAEQDGRAVPSARAHARKGA